MEWSEYEQNFKINASRKGYDQLYIDRCLKYALKIFNNKVPVIYSTKHLSKLVGYDLNYLYGVSNAPQNYYRKFKIKKKSGGERIIKEPLPSLKIIQRWIHDNILSNLLVSKNAKGFVKKRSIKSGALLHRKQRSLLTLDIEDFFGTIREQDVFKIFKGLGYRKSIATLLTKICYTDDALPQGAPTSPVLSNLILLKTDIFLSRYCEKRRIRYTRYADDLTFSGDFDSGSLIRFVKKILSEKKLRLNEKKTRLRRPHQRQEVNGIVVNQKINPSRSLRKKIRQIEYYIRKFGLVSHMQKTDQTRANYVNHVRGLANFILFLDPLNKSASALVALLSEQEKNSF